MPIWCSIQFCCIVLLLSFQCACKTCDMTFFFISRHCLWIVGNGTTLSNSKSIWQKIIKDAQDRGCFFDANDDKDLSNAIIKAIIEHDDAENLSKMDSMHISRPRFQVLTIRQWKNYWKQYLTPWRWSFLFLLCTLQKPRPNYRSWEVWSLQDSVSLDAWNIIWRRCEGLFVQLSVARFAEGRKPCVLLSVLCCCWQCEPYILLNHMSFWCTLVAQAHLSLVSLDKSYSVWYRLLVLYY